MDNRVNNAKDTFLHFLADNLPSITIHARRNDTDDPGAADFAENAVNVEFIGFTLDPVKGCQQEVSIDVLFSNERQATDTAFQVYSIMSAAFYTPLLDYTDIASPVSTGKNLTWGSIRFKKVYGGEYTHYVCLLSLRFDL